MTTAETQTPEPRLAAVADVLDLFTMPVALYDRDGVVVAINAAATRASGYASGELVGRRFGELTLAATREAARAHFARCIASVELVEFETIFVKASGEQAAVRLRLLPLAEGPRVVAVLMVAYGAKEDHLVAQQLGDAPSLTRRQHEILVLLASAHSTADIAERLGLATETVRNHVRALLKELNAHSRLEAVVIAERLGMLPPTPYRPT